MKLEDLKGEQPDTVDSDPDQDTPDLADSGFEEKLDELLEEEPEPEEGGEPAGETEEETPEQEPEKKPEDEAEPDAAKEEDAGQNADEETPKETPGGFETLNAVDEQTYQAVSQEFDQTVDRAKQAAARKHAPKYHQIQGQKQQIVGKIKELQQKYTADDGTELPMSMQDTASLNDLMNQAREVVREEKALNVQFSQDIADQSAEATIQGNMKLWPVLKKYEKEYRELAAAGFDCSDAGMVLSACQALRIQRGGKIETAPPKPQVSKADVEKATLQENLDRKNRGKVLAGSKGAGSKPGASKPQVSKALQADLDEITQHFGGL